MSILAFPLPLRLRRGGNPLLRLLFWGAKPSARSGEATRAEVNRKAEALLDAHGSSIRICTIWLTRKRFCRTPWSNTSRPRRS